MNRIPSNFTLEETLKWMPESKEINMIRHKFINLMSNVNHDQEIIEIERKESELVSYQLFDAEQLLEGIKELVKKPGNKRELIKSINELLEESSYEC